ncbi:MAG TPA: hypothetical protein VNT32_03820 [Thermoleophilaceae bacterium]|nr:hypothetical protein [Thermoleophilaceae bacterium]
MCLGRAGHAAFEKVRVSSRGEPVARVFADHYAQIHHGEPAPADAGRALPASPAAPLCEHAR